MDEQMEITEELYEYGYKETEILHSQQKKDRDILLSKVAEILLIYNIVNSSMKIIKKNKNLLRRDINKLIKNICSKQAINETKKIEIILNTVGNKKYNYNTYLLSLGLNVEKKSLNDLDKILNETIKGKNYKDRIWTNKEELAMLLQKEIKDFLDGKIDVNKIYDIVKTRFNSSAYKTKRLVENEISRVQNRVNDKWEQDYNIKYVMYSATLDSRTCSDCTPYDGWIGNVKDKPVILPQHVKCRCCYVATVDMAYNPKTRIDNESKKIIPYLTYDEWIKSK